MRVTGHVRGLGQQRCGLLTGEGQPLGCPGRGDARPPEMGSAHPTHGHDRPAPGSCLEPTPEHGHSCPDGAEHLVVGAFKGRLGDYSREAREGREVEGCVVGPLTTAVSPSWLVLWFCGRDSVPPQNQAGHTTGASGSSRSRGWR